MADSLAFTIPFSLGRFKASGDCNLPSGQTFITIDSDEDVKPYPASLVVWQLTIASSLEGIDLRQQQWFRSELAQLGRTIGNGILEAAETGEWAML